MMTAIGRLGYRWVNVYDDRWECEGEDLPRLVIPANKSYRPGRYRIGTVCTDGGLKRLEGVRASKGTGRYVWVGTPLLANMAMAGVRVFTITNYGDVISQPSEGHMPIVWGHRYEEPLFEGILSGHYRIEVDSRGRVKNWYRILKSERWPQRAYNVKQWGDDYKRKMTDGYKVASADPQGRRRVEVVYLDGECEENAPWTIIRYLRSEGWTTIHKRGNLVRCTGRDAPFLLCGNADWHIRDGVYYVVQEGKNRDYSPLRMVQIA